MEIVIERDDEKVTDAQRVLKPIRERTRAAGIPWVRVLERADVTDRAYYYWLEGHDMYVSNLVKIQRATDELITEKGEIHG